MPHAINQRWSFDFVSDTLSDGWRFRILCVVDDFSRECLATVVDTSLGGVRVVLELERLVTERAVPQEVVSDNGTELTSGAVLRWATGRLAWHYIEPGKPLIDLYEGRVIQLAEPRRSSGKKLLMCGRRDGQPRFRRALPPAHRRPR